MIDEKSTFAKKVISLIPKVGMCSQYSSEDISVGEEILTISIKNELFGGYIELWKSQPSMFSIEKEGNGFFSITYLGEEILDLTKGIGAYGSLKLEYQKNDRKELIYIHGGAVILNSVKEVAIAQQQEGGLQK